MADIGAAASRAAVRAFLRDIVGVGGTFTMLGLRAAVPDANQVDRRMRELRQADPPWRIASSQSDPSLPNGTYRLDAIGGENLVKKPSARVRRRVLEEAGNRCQVCGIGLGEEYADYPGEIARLQLGHWIPLDQGGSSTAPGNLRSECHLCNGGIGSLTRTAVTRESVEARVRSLAKRHREDLLRWVLQGRRDVSEAETLYYELNQLPVSARDEVVSVLRASLLPSGSD